MQAVDHERLRELHRAAERQRERKAALKAALLAGDVAEALRCARELVGLDAPEGDSAPPRL